MTSPEDGASPPSSTSGPDDPGGQSTESHATESQATESQATESHAMGAPPADSGRPDADTHATTELPATGWGATQADDAGSSSRGSGPGGSDTGGGSGFSSSRSGFSSSGDPDPGSGGPGSSGPSWSSEETRNYPTYQPQSYPTYPPTQTNTSALPAVSAGGPPPTTAAAYGGSASAGVGATATGSGKPPRRAGAGFAGALGLIGLSAAAVGALGLPIQQYAQNQNAYFGTYRDLAARKLSPNTANQHSISLVGGHIATDWWRFGVYVTLGVLALLFLIKICVTVLRRVAGVLLFLGGLGAVAGFLLGARQTNDYRSVTLLGHIRRVSWHHLAYGFWVAVAGCAVVALAGLIAAFQSTRR